MCALCTLCQRYTDYTHVLVLLWFHQTPNKHPPTIARLRKNNWKSESTIITLEREIIYGFCVCARPLICDGNGKVYASPFWLIVKSYGMLMKNLNVAAYAGYTLGHPIRVYMSAKDMVLTIFDRILFYLANDLSKVARLTLIILRYCVWRVDARKPKQMKYKSKTTGLLQLKRSVSLMCIHMPSYHKFTQLHSICSWIDGFRFLYLNFPITQSHAEQEGERHFFFTLYS